MACRSNMTATHLNFQDRRSLQILAQAQNNFVHVSVCRHHSLPNKIPRVPSPSRVRQLKKHSATNNINSY